MTDNMALIGYGVKMENLAPYIALEKFYAFVEHETEITLNRKDLKKKSLTFVLNVIDSILYNNKHYDGIAGILEKSSMPIAFEFLSNNRGEFFLCLPSCLPWERADSAPETMEETQAIIYKTLRPFLKDDTTPDDIAALYDHIYNIS